MHHTNMHVNGVNLPQRHEEMEATGLSDGSARLYLPKQLNSADIEHLADWLTKIIERRVARQSEQPQPDGRFQQQANAFVPMKS